jgi:plasmid replication initiation protein
MDLSNLSSNHEGLSHLIESIEELEIDAPKKAHLIAEVKKNQNSPALAIEGRFRVCLANSYITQENSRKLVTEKIIRAMISCVKPNSGDMFERTYTFYVDELEKNLGLGKRSIYNKAQEYAAELATTQFLIEDENQERGIYIPFGICAYDKSQGIISLLPDPRLKDIFTGLGKDRPFFQHSLTEIRSLKSMYSILLHDLIKVHLKGRNKVEFEELLEFFFSKWKLPNSYRHYSSFRQRVIEPAISELSTYMGLSIEVTPVKRGRKIIGIKFSVERETLPIEAKEIMAVHDDFDLITRLKEAGIQFEDKERVIDQINQIRNKVIDNQGFPEDYYNFEILLVTVLTWFHGKRKIGEKVKDGLFFDAIKSPDKYSELKKLVRLVMNKVDQKVDDRTSELALSSDLFARKLNEHEIFLESREIKKSMDECQTFLAMHSMFCYECSLDIVLDKWIENHFKNSKSLERIKRSKNQTSLF